MGQSATKEPNLNPDAIPHIPDGLNGNWAFMQYNPHGCIEVTDCIHEFHLLEKEGSVYKMTETMVGDGCTEE